MKKFKQTPSNLIQILNQSIWLNENLKINNKYMYNKQFTNKGILYIKDILDDNGDFLTHNEMISKYKLATTFIECLQLKSCIPTEWKDQISKFNILANNILDGNCIVNNNRYTNIENTQCKDLYSHLIEMDQYNHNSKKDWIKEFPDLETVNDSVWKRVFNLPFSTTRDTKIQSYQFRIFHKIIHCNKRLCSIKIKSNSICNFCDEADDMLHFFINCKKS